MGHYYSEMYSEEKLEKERKREIEKQEKFEEAVRNAIREDRLPELLYVLSEDFKFPGLTQDRIIRTFGSDN